MKYKSLTFRFLENLAESLTQLNNIPNDLPFNPTIAVLSALILTIVAALTYSFKILIVILFISIVLVSLLNRSSLISWIKIILFIFTWAFIVSAPLPFITTGVILTELSVGFTTLRVSFEGIHLMLLFTARVVSSAAVFTAFVTTMGWRGMVSGLEGLRMPKEFSFMLNLSIINIPIFLRETLNMLLAREARIMRKDRIWSTWGALASIIGELVLRGYERAWRLDKSIRARSFNGVRKSEVIPSDLKIKVRDIVMFSLTSIILLLAILEGV